MSNAQVDDYYVIPDGWEVKTIGEIAKKITDGAHQSPKPCEQGRYMCSVKDMTYRGFDFSNCKKISQNDFDKLKRQGCNPQKNDILISKDGANCLDIIFVYNQDEEIVLLSSIAIVRLIENYSHDYLRYFLLSSECQYVMRNGFVSGSAIPRVVLKDFKRVPLLLPSYKEQKAIASVLSSLDDKIDLLHRQNKTLEAMAETLFRQWFIEEAQDDWEDGCLGDLVNFNYGKGLTKEIRTGFGYPVIGSNGIVDYHNEYIVEAPGIVIGRKGTLGKTIYLSENFYPIDTTYFVTSKKNSRKLIYEYFLLKSFNFEDMNTDSAVPGLNREIALGNELKIPPVSLVEKFNSTTSYFFDKIRVNNSQIRTIEKLRDNLLPKLMSGEVRVNYA